LQKGVYRTNCLDCLDRTNVTQARISVLVLGQILAQIKAASGPDLSSFGGDSETQFVHAIHKKLWSGNGDKLS
jgi:hypothetical protein